MVAEQGRSLAGVEEAVAGGLERAGEFSLNGIAKMGFPELFEIVKCGGGDEAGEASGNTVGQASVVGFRLKEFLFVQGVCARAIASNSQVKLKKVVFN